MEENIRTEDIMEINRKNIIITISLILISIPFVINGAEKIRDCNHLGNYLRSENADKMDYSSIITVSTLMYSNSENSDSLFNDDFISIYENPISYYPEAILLITDNTQAIQSRIVALNSMFKLPSELYSVIFERIYNDYEKNPNSENYNLLHEAIYSSFGRQHKVTYCYKNEGISRTLNRMILNDDLSLEDKVYIQSILFGDAKKSLKSFYKESKT